MTETPLPDVMAESVERRIPMREIGSSIPDRDNKLSNSLLLLIKVVAKLLQATVWLNPYTTYINNML